MGYRKREWLILPADFDSQIRGGEFWAFIKDFGGDGVLGKKEEAEIVAAWVRNSIGITFAQGVECFYPRLADFLKSNKIGILFC